MPNVANSFTSFTDINKTLYVLLNRLKVNMLLMRFKLLMGQ